LNQPLIEIKRTHSSDPDFRELVKKLDADLISRHGEHQAFYARFNRIEAIGLYMNAGYVSIPNYGQYEGFENSVCFEKVII